MDNRKNEILDVTRRLINEKGLINTSTNDIARAVGISRGTLYHHFESKEAILDALVDKVSADIYMRAREIAQDKSIPVMERILKTVLSVNVSDSSDHVILEHLNSPNNILLHQKVQKEMLATLPGILASIIEDGNEQGVFNAKYPYECMEMLVAYTSLVFDGDFIEMSEEESTNRLVALMHNIERMLGAEEGAFNPFVEAIAYGKRD
ncbi:MAG: TetR/AcrR family transcriptional regulator [Christensenellales bacterium]|jgi:AcrR family transcriptional regulator